MARETNDNVLGLAPLSSEFGTATHLGLGLWSSHQSLTQDERQLIDEARKRQLAIDIISTQARFAVSKINEMHQHASGMFDTTCNLIIEIKDRLDRDAQHQAYIDQFSEHQIRLLAQHSLAMIEMGATNIGTELHQSPYPPSSSGPKRPAGFLQRLFRG